MKNTGNVPKLRFPEFRDAGEWEEKELTKFCACGLSNGVFNDPKKVGSGYKLINVLDMYIDTVIDEEKLSLVELSEDEFNKNKVEKGDIFFTRSSLVKSGIAYSNIYLGSSSGITFDGHLIRFRPDKKRLIPIFANYLLRTNRVRAQLVARGKTATMTTIGQADVGSIKLSVPEQGEQQKIADCLTSIDDLVTAQTQKIAALKAHKKGLMQQLFPAEGETLPKLRFPEFRNAEEWEEKRLGEVGSVRMCKRIFKEQTSTSGDIPFYKIGTFGGAPDAFISREIFENYKSNYPFPKIGSVLISAAGTIGRTVLYKGELAYFQDSNIVWLDNNENLIADNFLFYLYQLINWAPSVGAIQRLYNENILGAQVKFPSIPEQQKIANCLSSIDELITAQTQKLEALKAHKKGLMQQLFPNTETENTP